METFKESTLSKLIQKMTEEPTLELSLLENGLDFIIRGMDELYELYDYIESQQYIYPIPEPQKDYKYGVLHLFSGFLLLLKEKLARHKPELIFAGKEEDRRKKLNSGDGKTVNLDEALSRLKTELKVTFSERDAQLIKEIQGYRNRFEHYKIARCDIKKLKEVIIGFIDLIDRFLIHELQIDITSTSLNTSPEIRVKLESIESIYKRITDKRKHELMVLGEEKLTRFQSNRENILQELDTKKHIVYREEGIIDITMVCPECCEDSLIIYGEFFGVCFNKECNSYSLLKSCDRCGQVTTGYEWEEKWCGNCYDEIQTMVERDD